MRSRGRESRGGAIVGSVLALLLVAPAAGTQHLVRAGASWSHLESKLKPGDEIILMPGRHRPVTLSRVQGTSEKPIVIHGLDPNDPPTIEANRYGIRLLAPRHLRIENIVIAGATIHGIALDGTRITRDPAAGVTEPPENEPPGAYVWITNVTVTNTGPTDTYGQRHAILVRNVDHVTIRNCRIESWAGTGIELIGSDDFRISGTHLTGTDDRVQLSGIRIRATSRGGRIEGCWFENTGEQGICIGGGSKPADFRPALDDDAEPGTLYEASRIQVQQCVFRGGLSAVAFSNCDRVDVRHCTIIRPRRAVLSIRRDQEDARFGNPRHCTFASNLITWEPGNLTWLAHIGPGGDTGGMILEQNLWWSSDLATTLANLGAFPGSKAFPQITDVDPRLDENLRPTAKAALSFGAAIR